MEKYEAPKNGAKTGHTNGKAALPNSPVIPTCPMTLRALISEWPGRVVVDGAVEYAEGLTNRGRASENGGSRC